jgi:hypothetical protein
MERLSGDISGLMKSNPTLIRKYTDEILVQVLFAMHVYQSEHKIVHGDIHTGNVFYKLVTEEDKYHGESLYSAKEFSYQATNPVNQSTKTIYTRAVPLLTKIADYGLASKYTSSEPGNIMPIEIFDGGYADLKAKDKSAWVPNFFNGAYDPLMFINSFYHDLSENKLYSRRVDQLMEYLYDPSSKYETFINITTASNRPKISQLGTLKKYTPFHLLFESGVFDDMMTSTEYSSILLGSC